MPDLVTRSPLSGDARKVTGASRASSRPRDQQWPTAWVRSVDPSDTAVPVMMWPEARRSPSVGIAGATPTPSADTQATARPAAVSSWRVQGAHATLPRGVRPTAPRSG